jgi:hypothetical protein
MSPPTGCDSLHPDLGLDYVTQSDGSVTVYRKDSSGNNVNDKNGQPEKVRSLDRDGKTTVFRYQPVTEAGATHDVLADTSTYSDSTLSDLLQMTLFDSTGNQTFSYDYDRTHHIVKRSEYDYSTSAGDYMTVSQYDTTGLGEADAKTAGKGKWKSTTYYTKTVFGVPIINPEKPTVNDDGSTDTYTYDSVGRGLLRKVQKKNKEGHLLYENFFLTNAYSEPQLYRTMNYQTINGKETTISQSIFFYVLGKLDRIEEYKIVGDVDDVKFNDPDHPYDPYLSPKMGDSEDIILSKTYFKDGNPETKESFVYLSDNSLYSYDEIDYTGFLYNLRGEVESGILISRTYDRKDLPRKLKSETQTEFENFHVLKASTLKYDSQEIVNEYTLASYEGVLFDDSRRRGRTLRRRMRRNGVIRRRCLRAVTRVSRCRRSSIRRGRYRNTRKVISRRSGLTIPGT